DDVGRAAFGQVERKPARIRDELGIENLAYAAQLVQYPPGRLRPGLPRRQTLDVEVDLLLGEVEMLEEEVFRELLADELADFGQRLILGCPALTLRHQSIEIDLFAGRLVDGLDGPGGRRNLADRKTGRGQPHRELLDLHLSLDVEIGGFRFGPGLGLAIRRPDAEAE